MQRFMGGKERMTTASELQRRGHDEFKSFEKNSLGMNITDNFILEYP